MLIQFNINEIKKIYLYKYIYKYIYIIFTFLSSDIIICIIIKIIKIYLCDWIT